MVYTATLSRNIAINVRGLSSNEVALRKLFQHAQTLLTILSAARRENVQQKGDT